MTIAELRRKEVRRLAEFKSNKPTETDYDEAQRLMNSFYRLCHLAEGNLYRTNCEATCNTARTKKSEEREYNWWKRLDAKFNELYGLRLVYCGYMPSIGTVTEHGGFAEKIQRFFY